VTIDESGQDGMVGRPDQVIERTETLKILPRSDLYDPATFDDERAIPDVSRGRIAEDDEGISHHQCAAHRGPPLVT
jgi:hypothetical protein